MQYYHLTDITRTDYSKLFYALTFEKGSNWLLKQQSNFAEVGVSIEGEFVNEYSVVFDGGVHRHDSNRRLLTFDVELDLEKLVGLKGGTVLVQFLNVTRERGGSADAGDIQAYSNLESQHALSVLYELWYQQELLDGRLRFKVGKVDANSEFNDVDAAGDFANSSAGFSPTIFDFPTYPDPSMSVNVFATLVQQTNYSLTLGYGIYDGAAAVDSVRLGSRGPSTFFSNDRSDDYFQVLQADWAWQSSSWIGAGHPGRMSVGGWYHNGDFTQFDGSQDEATHGFFFTIEQQLCKGGSGDDSGVYVFGQYGWADEELSEVAQHFGAGLVARGTLAGRAEDSTGIYVSHVDLSDDPAAGFGGDETVIDAFYRFQLSPHFYIQPEVQYIIHPSGDQSVDDALVGGVRLAVSF